MQSAWLLPEDIADVLPAQARHIESLRRALLDLAQRYGFELVMPPLIEYLDSLLSGTGHALDLQTFKLIDQLTGRTLGLRADTTPQVARIDAHLLNRQGVARLCYCGPVVHTHADTPDATREPLQWGAEIYGHAGLEADLEVIELALDALAHAGVKGAVIDLGDARIARGVMGIASGATGITSGAMAGLPMDVASLDKVVNALSDKDAATLTTLTHHMNGDARDALHAMLDLYGDASVLAEASRKLPARPMITQALSDLQWLGERIQRTHPDVRVTYDLADMSGYAYYSGLRFAVYTAGSSSALVRGGRYDEVGAVFGRNRPAAGFSLDLKALADVGQAPAAPTAILAPWGEDESLRSAIRALRAHGETVVCMLPGHGQEDAFLTGDRELVAVQGRWVVQALRVPATA
jgi:ATP phosphoribosyltransferase regulatory subunit